MQISSKLVGPKWPAKLLPADRQKVQGVSALLAVALSRSKKTQADFAKSIGENRTTISHIINCTNPATKNPVFKSMTIIKRVAAKLKKLQSPRMFPMEIRTPERVRSQMPEKPQLVMQFDNMDALDKYVRAIAKEAVAKEIAIAKAEAVKRRATQAPSPSPAPQAYSTTTLTKKTKSMRVVKMGQIWKSRDTRRAGNLVEVVAVHISKDPRRSSVRVKNWVKHFSQSQYDSFLKRFEYVAASKGRLKS